ncbi:hypothetical protein ACQ4PT_060045 [Festuca glaucescens]
MAPVVNHREALDHATGVAQPTFVVVESVNLRDGARVRYQTCNGFILYVLKGKVYVVVPKTKLDSWDFLSVRFQNNVVQDAKVCKNVLENGLDLFVLEVEVAGNFESVNIGNMPCDRTDVLILAQAKMEDELQFSTYSSSVIFPSNESLPGFRKHRPFQNPDFFSIGFSANMKIDAIIGAPVFNLDGIFLGIIHSFGDDLVYVRSSHFIPKGRMQIEMKSAQVQVQQG